MIIGIVGLAVIALVIGGMGAWIVHEWRQPWE